MMNLLQRQHFGPLALAVVLLLSGCVSLGQGRQMQEELVALQARQAELEEESAQRQELLAEMIDGAREDIEEIESVLKEAREILSRDSANLGADVQRNREEMGRLQGEVEELAFRFRRFNEAFDYYREDVELRFAEEWPSDPEELLAKGRQLREDGMLSQARRGLERFLSRHGEHVLVPVARLEFAEVLFAQEQWVGAITEFQKLLSGRNSSSDQKSRSALRIGQSFIALGKCEDGSLFLETVAEDYPGTEDAREARFELAQINSGGCPDGADQ